VEMQPHQQQQAMQPGLGPGLQQQQVQQQLSLQEYVLLQQQQQQSGEPPQHPQQRQVESLPYVRGVNASASSSGVCLNNSSSMGLDGSTVGADCSATGSTGGNAESTETNGGLSVPLKAPQVQHSSVLQ
jgi:hypothetical protein